MKPTIISSLNEGSNSSNLEETIKRLTKESAYKDLSCILLIPALENIPTRIVASWLNLINPPNQKVAKLFAQGMEVGEAYSQTIEAILQHPELSSFKYIITLEHDNAPSPDSLVKLLAIIDNHPEYIGIGGLYFTKGYGGVAQIWGDPKDHPIHFRPQLPVDGQLIECNGLGMGFTCFRLSLFKDERLPKPWFKTLASSTEGVATQDIYFCKNAKELGYRFAVDCSIKVGHWDTKEEIMW